jgi:ORF6N domain
MAISTNAGETRAVRTRRRQASCDHVEDCRINRCGQRCQFPPDFVMQLTGPEADSSRSQSVTLNAGRGHNLKYLPLAFTEHGAIMAATILNSPRAVEMSVHVVRAFVQLKHAIRTNAGFAERFRELEHRLDGQDAEIAGILEALRALTVPPEPTKLEIGFLADHSKR